MAESQRTPVSEKAATRVSAAPVYLTCAAIPAAFILVLVSWHWRAPDEIHVAGLYQGDMATYLCNARMAAENLAGIAYASPYDVREPPRAVFIQLPITLLGVLLRIGLSPQWAAHGLRWVFGFLMLLGVAALLRRILPEERWFWAAFLVISIGGGFAWCASLLLDSSAAGLVSGIVAVEARYYWWFLNIFRNLLYPLETVYHALFFAHLLALGSTRWGAANLCLLVAALSNPFLMVQMIGTHLVCAVMGPGSRTQRALVLPISALFGLYYGLLLPMDSVGGALREAHSETYGMPLALVDMLVAYGPSLLCLAALAFDRRFRADVLQGAHTRPILAMTLWALVLVHHSRIPGIPSAQPMHFTRGYLFFGLWVLFFYWIRGLDLSEWIRARGLPRVLGSTGATLAALGLLVAATLPDNAAFVAERARIKGRHTFLWSQPTEALLEHLRGSSGSLRLIAQGDQMGMRICAFTQHRPLVGIRNTTPEYETRVANTRRFLAEPGSDEFIADYGIEAVVIPAQDRMTVERLRAADDWMRVFNNREWALFRRSNPK